MAKFIARKHFYNNCGLKIADAIHPMHVHNGAIFELGSDARGNALPFDKFQDMTAADKNLITQLNSADCIGDATNEKTVKDIMAEVAAEKIVEERAKEMSRQAGSHADIISQLVAALKAQQKAAA